MSKLKISHYKIRITDPALRPAQPFSVALLADFHNASFGERNEELLQAIRSADPKLILSAGDLVLGKAGRCGVDSAIELLGELTRRYPVYCVDGNHEQRMAEHPERFGEAYEEYVQEIRSLGVYLLNNSCRFLEVNRMKLAIYGYVPDWKYYGHGKRPNMQKQDLEAALGAPADHAYRILLAHPPSYFEAYAAWGADLTLAGHLHGGIIRLPGLGGVISPGWTLFPKYDHGMYQIREKRMIVSAGLASHTIKLRVNNPPELVVIDFL